MPTNIAHGLWVLRKLKLGGSRGAGTKCGINARCGDGGMANGFDEMKKKKPDIF
jgi:hypothetical protein